MEPAPLPGTEVFAMDDTGAVVSRNLTDDMLLTSGSRSNVVLLIVPRRYGRLSVSKCDMTTEWLR